MKSVQLAKALSRGNVWVRTGRKVNGQIMLKFRDSKLRDRLIHPYPLKEQNNKKSFVHLSKLYSADQLQNSNLEDLIVMGDLELGIFE